MSKMLKCLPAICELHIFRFLEPVDIYNTNFLKVVFQRYFLGNFPAETNFLTIMCEIQYFPSHIKKHSFAVIVSLANNFFPIIFERQFNTNNKK